MVDPQAHEFKNNLVKLGELTNQDINSWDGYLKPINQEDFFKEMGATSTDHGHPSARTENLSYKRRNNLYKRSFKR